MGAPPRPRPAGVLEVAPPPGRRRRQVAPTAAEAVPPGGAGVELAVEAGDPPLHLVPVPAGQAGELVEAHAAPQEADENLPLLGEAGVLVRVGRGHRTEKCQPAPIDAGVSEPITRDDGGEPSPEQRKEQRDRYLAALRRELVHDEAHLRLLREQEEEGSPLVSEKQIADAEESLRATESEIARVEQEIAAEAEAAQEQPKPKRRRPRRKAAA
jgi:hypothetical protein